MRPWLRKLQQYLPEPEQLTGNRWLAPLARPLLHPRLWHLNRHTVAGAVAAGLFCGLIPGPFQMLGAAGCALLFRINLPLALFVTLYTNPLTIVPLYLLACLLGSWASQHSGCLSGPPATDWQHPRAGLESWLHWLAGAGHDLALGLLLLGTLLAVTGYLLTALLWRWHLLHRWRQRQRRQHKTG